jgi:antitoxin CptB
MGFYLLELNMPDTQAMNMVLDARRRRIRFRSWHRGMLETDLLLGRFADAELANLSHADLDDYEVLLEAIDRDIFSWATGEVETPPVYDTPVFRKVVAFHGAPVQLKI